MKELISIQSELKAPKNQFNSFGGYKYRSCEDILEAVKPLLAKNKCTLSIADEMVAVGNRVYVKATCTLRNEKGETEVTTACARESESKKGMDEAQITGAASSYARKYALNGLFAIDDTKDADVTNTHGKEAPAPAPKPVKKSAPKQEIVSVELNDEEFKLAARANECKTVEDMANLAKQLIAENKWTANLAQAFTNIKLEKKWN